VAAREVPRHGVDSHYPVSPHRRDHTGGRHVVGWHRRSHDPPGAVVSWYSLCWHAAGYSLLPRNGPLRDGALLWYGRHPPLFSPESSFHHGHSVFGDVWGGHSHEITPAAPARLAPRWCCRAYCRVLRGSAGDAVCLRDCHPGPHRPDCRWPLFCLTLAVTYYWLYRHRSHTLWDDVASQQCGCGCLVWPVVYGVQTVAYRAA